MPSKQYLVRQVKSGKMRTVVAKSEKEAGNIASNKYNFEDGEVIEVKERGVGDWRSYKVYK